MYNNFITKSFPYILIFFFIFFEFSPIYFFENQLIRPYMTFTVVYCWICHDFQRFRPLSLMIFGLFYDLLQTEVVGITCLFFILIYHMQRKKSGNLISFDFKETWIKFTIYLLIYIVTSMIVNVLFNDTNFNFKSNFLCFILSIALFPLFFSIIDKLSYKFRGYND